MNKNKTALLFILTILMLSLYSSATNATDNNTTDKPYTAEEIEDARILAVPIEEYRLIPADIKEAIRASFIMYEFCTVENNRIKVNIAKEEAIEKGVSADGYKLFLAEMDKTNAQLKEGEDNGFPPPIFPDFKEYVAKYKKYLNGEISLDELQSTFTNP